VRHFEHRDQIAADLLIGIDHLFHASRRPMHEFVGEEDGEGFVANDVARAPDGMAEAQRLLLAHRGNGTGRQGRRVRDLE